MQEQYIVDRIEGKFAVVEKEDMEMCNILLNEIKGDPKEGDILIKCGEHFEVDEELTKIRKEKVNSMMKNMWK